MTPKEQEFIHDIVNKLTIAHGGLNNVIEDSEELSKEDILKVCKDVKLNLDKVFALVKARIDEA